MAGDLTLGDSCDNGKAVVKGPPCWVGGVTGPYQVWDGQRFDGGVTGGCQGVTGGFQGWGSQKARHNQQNKYPTNQLTLRCEVVVEAGDTKLACLQQSDAPIPWEVCVGVLWD